MGSRAALGLANEIGESADPCAVKGVICMGYPLHAEDDKEKLNDEALKAMTLPSLFISTVNDKTCDSEKLEEILGKDKKAKIVWVEGAEHFRKAKGRKESDVFDEINENLISFCKGVMGDGKKDDEKSDGEKKPGKEDKKRKSEGGDEVEKDEVKKQKTSE